MFVACAHMYEDTCKIHKEMFTYNFQEVVLRVKEEELEFYIFLYKIYKTVHRLILKSSLCMLVTLIKHNCL